MDYLDLPAQRAAQGVLKLPGSKSISNRVLLLAALGEGEIELHELLESDDTKVMLEALRVLGVSIEVLGDKKYRVQGSGGVFKNRKASLFLGNAGTAFRSLTAALAFSGGEYVLSGVPRMHERPIGDLVDALRAVGANIDYLGVQGFPPLRISAPKEAALSSEIATVSIRGDVSSQFLSGLLMALPMRRQAIRVEIIGTLISRPYVEMTLGIMARFGVRVKRETESLFYIAAGSRYRSPPVLRVEGDASSASYFLAAGALAGHIRVEGVGRTSLQGDVRFADALQAMGAKITIEDEAIEASYTGTLKGVHLDCNEIPDAAMTLAVLALFAEGSTRLSNIASWRVKETDRILAMATELQKLGAHVEADQDSITITPPRVWQSPASGIDTYEDHRMAMCFSLAAFALPVRINDPECVSKTFPDYFERLAELSSPVPVIAIDGPSASGKGTIASKVAARLGWHYLDSGALYRLAALAAYRQGVAWDDEASLAKLAAHLDVAFCDDGIYLEGACVNEEIRQEHISSGASQIAKWPALRDALLFRQRAFRVKPGLVADGRDMGSVVFPDAQTKVFLTASVEIRAERRYKQLIEKGISANIEPILQDLRERDARDTSRSIAPLQQSQDAQRLDTSAMTIEEAVVQVLAWSQVI